MKSKKKTKLFSECEFFLVTNNKFKLGSPKMEFEPSGKLMKMF